MKTIMFLFLLAVISKKTSAQFKGVLHYENDYVDTWFGTKGEVLTTIYESGQNIRIEAIDTSFSEKGVTKQNPLLIDINKGTETHLQDDLGRGVIYSISDREKQVQMMNDQAHTVYTFENAGQEKIDSFNCTHYVMTKSYAKLKTLKPARFDIWITQDLGSSNIWYVGKYLYLFGGMDLYKKLEDAGASGVVVKWQETESKPTTCKLTGYQKEALRPAIFTAPSNYYIVNATKFPVTH